MRIFAWTAGKPGQGSFRYRLTTPLTEAAYQGLAAWEWGPELSGEVARDYDVVLGQGFGSPQALVVWESMAREAQTVMVLDHDDDWRNIRPDNPILKTSPDAWDNYQKHTIPAVERFLEISDLVTVTVPHLAEQYQQFTDAPVVVLPNTFDEVLLEVPQRVRQPGEKLRVGWSGSPTHSKDWKAAVSGITYGLNKTKAQLVLMGADYRPLVKYGDVEFHEWKTAIDEYYLVLTTYHVALAPLADDMFNRSKSPLKALEASAFGIPVVASDAGPYKDFIVHGETGFLCKTDTDWMKALRELDNDEELRQAMGLKAREHARQFTTQKWAPEWIRSYEAAIARKHGAAAPAADITPAVPAEAPSTPIEREAIEIAPVPAPTRTDSAALTGIVWREDARDFGGFYYRIQSPLSIAEEQGLLDLVASTDIVDCLDPSYDVVITQRILKPERAAMWKELRQRTNALMVVEYDDDLIDLPPDNPGFTVGNLTPEIWQEHIVPAVKSALDTADLVTVTGSHLADKLRRHTDTPIAVLPNTVDEAAFEFARPLRQPGEPLVVGWAGSSTHAADWREVAEGVRYGLTKTKARFVMMGADYRNLVDYKDSAYIDWIDGIAGYYEAISRFHVALAPLRDTDFNRSKSPIKALEAAALGIPIVASDAGPYRDFVIEGETGFLCKNDTDWMKALRELDNDEDARRAMGQRAREHARQFTTQKWAQEWIRAYAGGLANKHGLQAALA